MGNAFRNQLLSLIAAAGASVLFGACTVHDTTVPPLAGPSESALSITVTASPDSILQDGSSQSTITVLARDANAKPISGMTLRLEMAVGGQPQDYGTLAARTVVTGSDGRATTTYTAPPMPATLSGGSGTTVQIIATPVGNDYAGASSRTVDIRLVPPGVILPPAGSPRASFTFTPTSPTAGSPAQFDASASCGSTDASGACTSVSAITSYAWDFGDGSTASGKVVTHSFPRAQQYSVTLTVSNDRGLSASTTQAVVVAAADLPTAAFTYSPTGPLVGTTVLFNADSSTAAAGHQLVQSNWDFGDPNSTPANPNTRSGFTASHVFSAPGTYTVTLSVMDDIGQKAVTTQTIDIK